MGQSSIQRQLDELERRVRDQPPARIDFTLDAQVLFSLGEGTPHRVDVSAAQAPCLEWIYRHRADDLSGAPIAFLGDNRMGQDDAGRLAAFILAHARGAHVRIYTNGRNDDSGIYDSIQRAMPPRWRHRGDRTADHFKIGRGEIELVSIRARKRWTRCDVAVLDFYSSRQGRREEALGLAPIAIVCGDQPDTEKDASDEQLLTYRDAAHAAGRLFRFRRDWDNPIDEIVNSVLPTRKRVVAEFWRPTGL